MKGLRQTGITLLCASMLIACSDGTTQRDEPKVITKEGDIVMPGIEDQSLADLAINTLADEFDVPVTTISVDSIRAMEWRDSSIGCPQPGQAYLQVITPGHRISLRMDGQMYFVHEANGRAFVCKKTKAVGGVTEKRELVWGLQAMQARKDLSERIGVEESLIRIAFAEGTTFSDTSLACPEEGVEYETRNIEGYVLGLRYGTRDFTYHTDLNRVIPCPPITED